MARPRKGKTRSALDDIHPLTRIAPADLERGVAEIVRLKGLASEYSSNTTAHKKLLRQRHNLNPAAFDLATKLNGMEVSKRQSFLRDLIYYSNSLGHFSQIDMFDDLIDDLRQILGAAQEKEGEAAPVSNGAEILSGLTSH